MISASEVRRKITERIALKENYFGVYDHIKQLSTYVTEFVLYTEYDDELETNKSKRRAREKEETIASLQNNGFFVEEFQMKKYGMICHILKIEC